MEKLKQVLKESDADKDGVITKPELASFVQGAQSILEDMDLDAEVRPPLGLGLAKLAKIAKRLQNFVNFWRGRSRLYRNEILQENMRSTAFLKLYKICILLHRCNLKIFAKNRFEKSAIFVKFQHNVAKFAKCCQISKMSA